MGHPYDILSLIITVYNTPAQPVTRRASTQHYVASRNTGKEEGSWKLFPGKADIEGRSCFENLKPIYLWRYTFFFFFHWHYSPLWALACRTRCFHFFTNY
jgi:hypothetical protein